MYVCEKEGYVKHNHLSDREKRNFIEGKKDLSKLQGKM